MSALQPFRTIELKPRPWRTVSFNGFVVLIRMLNMKRYPMWKVLITMIAMASGSHMYQFFNEIPDLLLAFERTFFQSIAVATSWMVWRW
ncbi:MAG: hypothetical protein ACXWT3_01100 [Methylococcaceae bacterium]